MPRLNDDTTAVEFTGEEKVFACRIFGLVVAFNFFLYAIGEAGTGAVLTLLLAAALISQAKPPQAQPGGKILPDWMMKPVQTDPDFAERITSTRFVAYTVAGFLLISAAVGAVL